MLRSTSRRSASRWALGAYSRNPVLALGPSAGRRFRLYCTIDRYVPGSVVKEDAFTSSSADPAQAFAGNTKFFIDSFHGKDVKAWSSVESELEILFDKGTSFDVISKTYDSVSHTYYIGLREVP
jgi:hypothetical protein